MDVVTYHDLQTILKDPFENFEPAASTTLHSHVYPYFVQWCRDKSRRGVRWIHTYHAFYSEEAEGRHLLPWEEEINRTLIDVACYADVRISVSRWQQRHLADLGINSVYLPNGVDVSLCDAGVASRFSAAHGDDPFVLYVGRDESVKNPADFVRLAARLPENRFVMIGDGLSLSSHSEWRNVLTDNVILLGRQQRSTVQDAMAACTAVVVTSVKEGLPTVVLEALTHGKPVVVPDDPGCMEPVAGKEFGLVYRQGDIESLTSMTEAAISGKSYFPEGRETALGEYDWKVIGPKLDAIYDGADSSYHE